jgi:hypothetical protein
MLSYSSAHQMHFWDQQIISRKIANAILRNSVDQKVYHKQLDIQPQKVKTSSLHTCKMPTKVVGTSIIFLLLSCFFFRIVHFEMDFPTRELAVFLSIQSSKMLINIVKKKHAKFHEISLPLQTPFISDNVMLQVGCLTFLWTTFVQRDGLFCTRWAFLYGCPVLWAFLYISPHFWVRPGCAPQYVAHGFSGWSYLLVFLMAV